MDIRQIVIDVNEYEEGVGQTDVSMATSTYSGDGPDLDQIIIILEGTLSKFYSIREKKIKPTESDYCEQCNGPCKRKNANVYDEPLDDDD